MTPRCPRCGEAVLEAGGVLRRLSNPAPSTAITSKGLE